MADSPDDADPGDRPRRVQPWWPLRWWGALFGVFIVGQHVSNHVLRDRNYQFRTDLHYLIDGWQQFDGHEYAKIATSGYWYEPGVRSPVVWFPLYPNLVRLAHHVFSDVTVAGIVVSALAGMAAVCVYWRWVQDRHLSGAAAAAALGVLMLYPYGWFLYGVVHSDSLFLALVVGAFLLVERDRLVLAGIVGALATATRPTGMAVIPGLVFLALERGGVFVVPDAARGLVARFAVPVRVVPSKVRPRLLAPALCVAGLAGYVIYLGVRFGDPLAFIDNQRVYHPGDLPFLKRAYFVAFRDATDPRLPLTLTGQAIATLLTLISVPFVGRRFGWGYGVYCLVLVCIPLFSTEDFMGTGRYLIAAFPSMALAGELLSRNPRRQHVVLAASGALMVFLGLGFARSWYLT